MRRDHADSNAAELLANLAAAGWACIRIASAVQTKAGLPDAIVARRGSRLNHFLEIKALGGRMRPSQIEFARTWPSRCYHVASSSWEANLLLEECEDLAVTASVAEANTGKLG